MTSAVAICNTALSHLGSDAQIGSLDPPDGSKEAGYCARFYPIARRELIEAFPWTFAKDRQGLTELVDNPSQTWAYAYARPSGCLRALRVLPLNIGRVLPAPFVDGGTRWNTELLEEQDSAKFQEEDGVIFTHEPEAVLIFIRDVVDTTRFSPTFVSSLGYLLSAYLAGPIIRGDKGRRVAGELREAAFNAAREAMRLNASNSSEDYSHTPAWLRNR